MQVKTPASACGGGGNGIVIIATPASACAGCSVALQENATPAAEEKLFVRRIARSCTKKRNALLIIIYL